MGKDLWENNQKVKDLFKLASDKTSIDMENLLFEGSEDDLKATDKTQAAITLVNLSASLVLKEKGITAEGFAGFSLGEFSALCEAGIISTNDIFNIVKARGDIMEKVSRSLDSPAGNPGMAAVIGLEYKQMEQLIKDKGLEGVYLANYNGTNQIVLSGTFEGLRAAEAVMSEAGAKRYIMLKVSGPFHCPLLDDARKEFTDVLGNYEFSDPTLPVYSNVTGKLITSGKEARELSIQQVTSTVKWVNEMDSMIADGYDRFIEAGPGKVLAGLIKRHSKDHSCLAAATEEDINKIIEG
ncbi:MAG: ACP S-malonyltransferase [Spirochaetales bacterium]|nr:ACP S-malonyltransferase [Spirochaetales bacterium]